MFYHIVAVTDNNVIGNKGKLPWNLRYDLGWWRRIVKGRPLIVGRKTFEAANPVFHNDYSIVIKSQFLSLREALTRTQDDDKVFIMGGASMFNQTLHIVKGIWMVRVHVWAEGDTYYPGVPSEMTCKYSYTMAEEVKRGLPRAEILYYERN